ncbi:CHASE2 domain-containing protein [Paraburkholderia caribensis]|uniref:CHASE2 domain-containing protein n=1 Tax=Paraburkholderia caribensis TaxID=75105 RepID=UPI002855C2B2|nr:CHASE2 domain-containing protein [Paraburkholderia caribensis]MDR6380835.1 CHASE2 domain-containing sensor protein/nitrogen-specific signal transduction histidine kinase [Paraburkholderia caribensis]
MTTSGPRMSFDPRIRLGRPVGRRFLFEWLCIGCLGVLVILAGSPGRLTASVDHLVYDGFLRLHAQPVLPDIAVVEIDNASIARLGRWPWPRAVHAQLLDEIAKAGPAAVVYDVLFTEPAPDDAQLARALAATPTYLPILLSPEDTNGERVAVKPVEPLASAAAGLGHINLEVDADGIVRSVALFEGDAHLRWPQLMVPVWRAIKGGTVKLAHGAGAAADVPERTPIAGNDEARVLIPFGPLAQTYPKVSFASVLAGDVPRDMLRGKIVLIGVTASGLYDRFSTPVSGRLGPLPGVYIHANVLDTLVTGRAIDPVNGLWVFAVSLVPLGVLLAGLLVLSPLRSLLMTIVLSATMLGLSAALLYGMRLWMSPVPAIVGLAAVYPIWNWRRLEMTMSYLRKELQRLADEPHLLPEAPQRSREFRGDALAQQMALMAQAARRVQDMKRFVWSSLDSVPEPILVSDVQGVVLIANHAAKAYCERLGAAAPEGEQLRHVLGELAFVKAIGSRAEDDALGRAHWPALLDPGRIAFVEMMERGIEVRDRSQRDHLLRYAKCTDAQGAVIGWIAGLVDVTAVHAAERLREDALRLLSHDMRSPQASILALVELERARTPDSERLRELLNRVERYAQRALMLADDFVQLARAESQAYALEPVSLVELVIDASDEVWPQAQARHIRLEAAYDEQGDGHWINADRSLMTRALVNILNNAVKYSPPDTRITCTVAPEKPASGEWPARVRCTVRDEGYGMSAENQAHLFERFQRFHEVERPEATGTGLGMAFVKAVVMRHGGDVHVESAPGQGTAFTITLPALDETNA